MDAQHIELILILASQVHGYQMDIVGFAPLLGKIGQRITDDAKHRGPPLANPAGRRYGLAPVAIDGLLAIRAYRDKGDRHAREALDEVDVVFGLAGQIGVVTHA